MTDENSSDPLHQLRDQIVVELAAARKRVKELEQAIQAINGMLHGADVAARFHAGSLELHAVIDVLLGKKASGGDKETESDTVGRASATRNTIDARNPELPYKPRPDSSQVKLVDYVLDLERFEFGDLRPRRGVDTVTLRAQLKEFFGYDMDSKAAARALSKAFNSKERNVRRNNGRYWRANSPDEPFELGDDPRV